MGSLEWGPARRRRPGGRMNGRHRSGGFARDRRHGGCATGPGPRRCLAPRSAAAPSLPVPRRARIGVRRRVPRRGPAVHHPRAGVRTRLRRGVEAWESDAAPDPVRGIRPARWLECARRNEAPDVAPAFPSGHRPRRHQDRDHRARRAAARELLRRRVPTPQGDYAATVAAIAALVHGAERDLGARGSVGIGTPGSISRATGLLRELQLGRASTANRSGKTSTRSLEREVRITNDANCFALSEATDGAGAGAAVVFGVILGTGVGGGIVVHGRSARPAPTRIAGEWGHNPLPWPRDDERPGPACYCGERGCIETFLSGPGMAARSPARDGAALNARARSWRAPAAGDAACEATLSRYEERLARALAHVINIARSGRHRAGRRHVQHRAAVRRTCRSSGGAGCSRTGSTRGWCATCTATPAACAARPGCGARGPELRRHGAASGAPHGRPRAGDSASRLRTPRRPRRGRAAAEGEKPRRYNRPTPSFPPRPLSPRCRR